MGDLSPNFSRSELACSHCGELGPWGGQANLDRLERLRHLYGRPMNITSGYRCPRHPLEAGKDEPGEHARGAIDVAVFGIDAVRLTVAAWQQGWMGFGWSQKGPSASRFVHLDRGESREDAPRPWAWIY